MHAAQQQAYQQMDTLVAEKEEMVGEVDGLNGRIGEMDEQIG